MGELQAALAAKGMGDLFAPEADAKADLGVEVTPETEAAQADLTAENTENIAEITAANPAEAQPARPDTDAALDS